MQALIYLNSTVGCFPVHPLARVLAEVIRVKAKFLPVTSIQIIEQNEVCYVYSAIYSHEHIMPVTNRDILVSSGGASKKMLGRLESTICFKF
jgi:hypothetical protein